ncbi:GAD-like domain-containing protein [Xenorhabdus budapestensis]|uniref:GAD-like domain-containing protein n=1 Tax=Xenorhabdus budapestensis TaxID=290110 RepID=UPI000C043B6E
MEEETQYRETPTETINQWRGKLPDRLLNYWSTEDWNSYHNGLFSIVNPRVYEDIVDM